MTITTIKNLKHLRVSVTEDDALFAQQHNAEERQRAYDVNLNLEDGYGIEAMGAEGEVLCDNIADALYDILNDANTLRNGRSIGIKYHPSTAACSAIAVPQSSDRSIGVNMKDPYNNNVMPAKIETRQGDLVFSQPLEKALMVSSAFTIYDMEAAGLVTNGGADINQFTYNLVQSVNDSLIKNIVGAVESHEGDTNSLIQTVADLEVTEDDYKIIAQGLKNQLMKAKMKSLMFGKSIQDYTVALSDKAFMCLEQAATDEGCACVDDFIGTDVFAFTPAAKGVLSNAIYFYILPKRHSAVSFRTKVEADGGNTVFEVEVTRQADYQRTIIEVNAVADLLLEGLVKTEDKTGKVLDASLPLITKGLVTIKA